MAEYIREIKMTFNLDSNKRSVQKTWTKREGESCEEFIARVEQDVREQLEVL